MRTPTDTLAKAQAYMLGNYQAASPTGKNMVLLTSHFEAGHAFTWPMRMLLGALALLCIRAHQARLRSQA